MKTQIKLFISHSWKDRKLATDLGDVFESFGIDVFIAHKDIEPSAPWLDRIIDTLRTTDVFVALLTKNFRTSVWTDQEVGIAVSLDKSIIPVTVNAMPHGFLASRQAHFLNKNNLRESCTEIAKSIDGQPRFRRRFRRQLIRRFADSADYTSSIAGALMLSELERLTTRQLSDVLQAGSANDQIYGCKANSILCTLATQNASLLPQDIRGFWVKS